MHWQFSLGHDDGTGYRRAWYTQHWPTVLSCWGRSSTDVNYNAIPVARTIHSLLTWITPWIAEECPAICQWTPLKWLASWLVTGIAPCGWTWALSTHMARCSQSPSLIMKETGPGPCLWAKHPTAWSESAFSKKNLTVGPHHGLMAPATSMPVLLLGTAHTRSRCAVIDKACDFGLNGTQLSSKVRAQTKDIACLSPNLVLYWLLRQ